MNLSIVKQILTLRKKTSLAIAILFVSALTLQLFINFYQKPKVDKLQSDWLKLREQEGRGAALLDRDTLYRNGQLDLAKFHEKIYGKVHFARFIGELYEMASRNNLDLSAISYKPTNEKEENLVNYALTLKVSGKYPQLKRFIYDLGSGKSNILVIDSIGMSSASGVVPDTVELKLSITSWFAMEAK
ncbi:MAG: hypothetical protein HXX17_07845 [Geobacteraceae bacterium]|nr:hypothetical protein [Geobacteraceae bacterium]